MQEDDLVRQPPRLAQIMVVMMIFVPERSMAEQ
jgi:hypothetical protein